MKLSRFLVLMALLWCAAPARAASAPPPRGVYVHVDFLSVLNGVLEQEGKPQLFPCDPVPRDVEDKVHRELRRIYRGWLRNHAIAGIKAELDWCRVQTRDPYCPPGHRTCHFVRDHGNDWSYVDDFFEEAAARGKFIHLIITPGIYSPPWLIEKLTDCTDVLKSTDPTSLPACGRVTFAVYPEQRQGSLILPMPVPWNDEYTTDWNNFLGDVAARYDGGDRYPGVLQSVGIGGPICGSIEMNFPTSENGSFVQLGSQQLLADDVWTAVVANNFGTATAPGQPFIDSWNDAIDSYQSIFRGVTLRLNPDDGKDFPELAIAPDVDDGTVYDELVKAECPRHPSDSCRAKVAVLYHFLYSSTPSSRRPANRKGLEDDGMTARTPTSFSAVGIGLQGIKFLTTYAPPANEPQLPGPILAGAQFDVAVTILTQQEGCATYPTTCDPLSFQQAAFNVFQVFFANTSPKAAALFDAVDSPPEYPVEYVSVASPDLTFANDDASTAMLFNGSVVSMQDLFAAASHALLDLIPGP